MSVAHIAEKNLTAEKPKLRVDWATHEAAKYACLNWHYSKCLPVGKLVKVGVWEGEKFIGVVLFSRGATPEIGSPYGLKQVEICELTRIALTKHLTPVSKVLSIAIKFLKKTSPNLKMIVSFADEGQGHHGGIYQATNWIYTGGSETHAYLVNGVQYHPKSLHSKYGTGGQSIPWLQKNIDKNAKRIISGFKHKYLMPLDDEMMVKIKSLSKPYPKRIKKQDSEHPLELGGAVPTDTLQLSC
jgi:hypothetical protein